MIYTLNITHFVSGRSRGHTLSLYLPTKFVSRCKKWMCTLCNICVRCAGVVSKSFKLFKQSMTNNLSVDLKSLPLAECQFESGRGHHQ